MNPIRDQGKLTNSELGTYISDVENSVSDLNIIATIASFLVVRGGGNIGAGVFVMHHCSVKD